MFGTPLQMLRPEMPPCLVSEWTTDRAEHSLGPARKLTEERLRISLQGIERPTMVVMGDPSAQDPKQVIQGLQLWRVGRQEGQLQPGAMPAQERRDLPGFVRTMEPGIVEED
jgi:hypothetical protein